MDVPDAKRAKREPRLDAVARMLDWLIAAGATGLDTIKVHATPDGGVGVASGEAGIAPGETIASIPATCVMSVGRSAASAVGRSVQRAINAAELRQCALARHGVGAAR